MDADRFQSSRVTPLEERRASPSGITLKVTASDARRIVRALEETSVSLGGSPSGAQLAGSYVRLASAVRQQAYRLQPAPD